MTFTPPEKDCSLCPRLVQFRTGNREKFPDKHNAPVSPFGSNDARLLVVGLAPGLRGANFTGRPFTGDYAGDLLYPTLVKYGWAKGVFAACPDDGLELIGARITNAVRCVPPENKPTTDEMNACRPFLKDEIAALPNLKVILSLGLISHNAVLKTYGAKLSAHKFAHGAVHTIPAGLNFSSSQGSQDEARVSVQTVRAHAETQDNDVREEKVITLIDSYHCSRYNTNTGRLTTKMFEDIFEAIAKL